MKIRLTVTDLLLACLPRRKVAGPEILRVVSVREHVVVFDWPGNVLGVSPIEEYTRGGVQQRDVGRIMLVKVLNQAVHLLEIKASIGVSEIAAPRNKEMVSLELGREVV